MPGPAVLIAAADRLSPLSARDGHAREVLAFADTDALRALETIMARRPDLVLLEREFASSPRGAALINRVRADPSLADVQVRIVSHEGASDVDAAPVAAALSVAAAAADAPDAGGAQQAPRAAEGDTSPAATPPPVLDQRGTRRAPRVRVKAGAEVLIDGSQGTLVDISRVGAQLVTATVFRPNQSVRLTLQDPAGPTRCGAKVVWAAFELPKGSGPRYRLGLEFVGADAAAIDLYIERNRSSDLT